MEIIIHHAKQSEWKIIQQLNLEVFEDNIKYDDALDLNWAISNKGISYFKKATSNRKYYCIIAEIRKRAVGYLIGTEKVCSYRTIRLAEIDNMGVSPEFRSNGIGMKLIQAYRAWVKTQGFDRIYVNAYSENERAIAFYKKCGLSPIDISLEGAV